MIRRGRERERERETDEKRVTVRGTNSNVGQSYVCGNRTCDYHASRLLAVVGKCKIDSLRGFLSWWVQGKVDRLLEVEN